jgi:hypothetical protein
MGRLNSQADSLLRHGHSKDKRPDLLQYRQMLGTLDPTFRTSIILHSILHWYTGINK